MVKMKCCLCEAPLEDFGHNPAPLNNNKGRCCTTCNFSLVIPARILNLKK